MIEVHYLIEHLGDWDTVGRVVPDQTVKGSLAFQKVAGFKKQLQLLQKKRLDGKPLILKANILQKQIPKLLPELEPSDPEHPQQPQKKFFENVDANHPLLSAWTLFVACYKLAIEDDTTEDDCDTNNNDVTTNCEFDELQEIILKHVTTNPLANKLTRKVFSIWNHLIRCLDL